MWAKTASGSAIAPAGSPIDAPLHERRFDRGLAPLPTGWRASGNSLNSTASERDPFTPPDFLRETRSNLEGWPSPPDFLRETRSNLEGKRSPPDFLRETRSNLEGWPSPPDFLRETRSNLEGRRSRPTIHCVILRPAVAEPRPQSGRTSMPLFHLNWTADGRRTFFPEEADTRRAVRTLVRVCGPRAVLYNAVDDHLHLVAQVGEGELGRLTQAVLLALRALTEVPFAPVHVKPVTDRDHLKTLVRYVLQQGPHHGLPTHPALAAGSCFADLVGARILPGFEQRLPRLLPRLQPSDIYAAASLPLARPPLPADDDALAQAGAARLLAACAAAVAAPPGLAGREPWVVDARAAFVQLAQAAGLPTRVVARIGELPQRTVQSLVHRTVPSSLLDAGRLRIALEDAVATLPHLAGDGEPPPYGGGGAADSEAGGAESW